MRHTQALGELFVGHYEDGKAFEQVYTQLTDPRPQRSLSRKWCGVTVLELAKYQQGESANPAGCPFVEGSPPDLVAHPLGAAEQMQIVPPPSPRKDATLRRQAESGEGATS